MKQPIIGIDGGATKVAGCILEKTGRSTFKKDSELITVRYDECPSFIPGFHPLPIQEQLAESRSGKLNLSEQEMNHGKAFVEACEFVINSLLDEVIGKPPIIGIGLPGLKTTDLCGIHSMNNGPRIPNFLNQLNDRLRQKNANNNPLRKIGNDNDFCGIGETYTEEGAFKNIQFGLYIGGGTGIADALLLNGTPTPFNAVRHWLPKTWEIADLMGTPMESLISHRGLMNQYASATKTDRESLIRNKIYPESFLTIDPIGEKIAKTFSDTLSNLIFDRILTLNSGWSNTFNFIDPSRSIEKDFKEKGNHFDRIVFGQRLGYLLGKTPHIFTKIKNCVSHLIDTSSLLSEESKHQYLSQDFIIRSNLRNASVLGAGIDAYFFEQSLYT